MTITGSARTRHVAVEVHPGGALASLRIDDQALSDPALADTLLALVRRATAEADQRTRHTLTLDQATAETLGLTTDPTLTEAVETTTPDSWRQQ